MQEGLDGLLRDKTRPSRIDPLGDEIAARIVALTLDEPPFEATHWTGAMMANSTAVAPSWFCDMDLRRLRIVTPIASSLSE